ncbi:MAG: BrnT family toxin [Alphaproteobacteria bacterium]|nr:BrnT family toxin [Alphaproteobacteria bacterium]
MYIKTKFGEFEWDDTKAESNFRKHGLKFTDAVRIFAGDPLTELDERYDYEETRKVSIGFIESFLIVTVVHTQRGKATRIISARTASAKDRRRLAAFIARRH